MEDARHQRIQQRAYQIWLRQGCPHGREIEHWRQAEREIATESQPSAPATADPRPQPSQAVHGADSQPKPQARPNEAQRHVDVSPSAATPTAAAGTDVASKKRSSRGKLKEDPGAATKGKPSKKHAGNGAVREPPRK